jgi:hypothetical protein
MVENQGYDEGGVCFFIHDFSIIMSVGFKNSIQNLLVNLILIKQLHDYKSHIVS